MDTMVPLSNTCASLKISKTLSPCFFGGRYSCHGRYEASLSLFLLLLLLYSVWFCAVVVLLFAFCGNRSLRGSLMVRTLLVNSGDG